MGLAVVWEVSGNNGVHEEEKNDSFFKLKIQNRKTAIKKDRTLGSKWDFICKVEVICG